MPPEPKDEEKPILSFISQSKKLNLKLKFKQPKLSVRNSMVNVNSSASPIFTIRQRTNVVHPEIEVDLNKN
jgi:hypothetical protein